MKHSHNFDHPSATFHSYIFPSNEQKTQNISKIPKISGSCGKKRIKQYEVLILFLTSLDLLNDVEKSTSTKKTVNGTKKVFLTGWVFVYKLNGCGFESSSSHLRGFWKQIACSLLGRKMIHKSLGRLISLYKEIRDESIRSSVLDLFYIYRGL